MIIEDLKFSQRRTGTEATVIGDDGLTFALDAEVAVQFRLCRGMNLSPELIEKIQKADEFLKARRRLIRYLALRKKSTSTAQRYLERAGFSTAAVDEAIDHATRLKYLDDSDFAECFVRTRTKNGTKGPRVVSRELQAKGISSEQVAQAVSTMTDPETQLDAARRVAAKKFPSLKNEDDLFKAARKMQQHLVRRGYDPDICDQVTREFFGDPTQF